MMGIGFPELMIILVIIMIIFGAGKLPQIGSALGNTIKNFKKSMKDAEVEPIENTGEGQQDAPALQASSEEGDPPSDSQAESPVTSSIESEKKQA